MGIKKHQGAGYTAVAYISQQESTRGHAALKEVRQIITWTETHCLAIYVVHILGVDNRKAQVLRDGGSLSLSLLPC